MKQTTFEFPTASYNFTINRKVSPRTTSLSHVCLAILMSRIVISTPYFYSHYGTLLLPSAGKYYNMNHVLQVQHCSSRKNPLCKLLEPALKKSFASFSDISGTVNLTSFCKQTWPTYWHSKDRKEFIQWLAYKGTWFETRLENRLY